MMRENKDINEHSIIEDYTANKNNIMKIQNAFKDIEFSNENENEAEPEMGRSSQRYSFKEEIVDTYIEEKVNNYIGEETEDKNYFYESDSENDTDLDGWDEDKSINKSKAQDLSEFYNFGI